MVVTSTGILEDHPNTQLGMKLAYEVHNMNFWVQGKFYSLSSTIEMMAHLQTMAYRPHLVT